MAINPIRIAVEGCGHGTLNAIYSSIKKSCEINNWDGVDLLIIGGDFQAVRNSYDLNCMSVPMKFREIGDFHEYYRGVRKAPYLTIFVGGNHEASNHLFELYYGGWVAPNIYYLGAANVVHLGPIRIAGLSGIWKGYNYNKSHHERLPYSFDDVKSIYHVREIDVRKLLQVKTQVDVGISHDWPRGVEWMGDWKGLFAKKDLFEADARAGKLGSLGAKYVMDRLRPPHWFSAHLHCKFSALVDHSKEKRTLATAVHRRSGDETSRVPNGTSKINGNSTTTDDGVPQAAIIQSSVPERNVDEIDIDMDDDGEPQDEVQQNNSNNSRPALEQPANDFRQHASEDLRALLPQSFARPTSPVPPPPIPPPPETIFNQTTRFLALDKCLPHRKFLQILEIAPISEVSSSRWSRPYGLSYDKEWLAITRVFAPGLTLGDPSAHTLRDQGEAHYKSMIEAEENWVEQNLVEKDKMVIPENFEITAPVFDPQVGIGTREQPKEYTNPQTTRFCEMLEISNPFDMDEVERDGRKREGPRPEVPRTGGVRGRGRDRGRGGGGGGRGRGRSRGRGRGN